MNDKDKIILTIYDYNKNSKKDRMTLQMKEVQNVFKRFKMNLSKMVLKKNI